jgi:hypothetical protein
MIEALKAEEREHLVEHGVPEAVVDALEDFIDEFNGALAADGWRNWRAQAHFVANRLMHYAFRLENLRSAGEALADGAAGQA